MEFYSESSCLIVAKSQTLVSAGRLINSATTLAPGDLFNNAQEGTVATVAPRLTNDSGVQKSRFVCPDFTGTTNKGL